jgi:predicted nucleic acid-binding protein
VTGLLVVDSSALIEALIPTDARGDAVIARLSKGDALFAPALIDYEVCAVVSSLSKPTPPKVDDPQQAIRDLLGLTRIRRVSPDENLCLRAFELRHNLSGYDAVYVALAESLGASLLTCDGRIARASGPRCAVEYVGPEDTPPR